MYQKFIWHLPRGNRCVRPRGDSEVLWQCSSFLRSLGQDFECFQMILLHNKRSVQRWEIELKYSFSLIYIRSKEKI